MSVELVRFKELSVEGYALRVHRMALDNADMLRDRYYWGTAHRYGEDFVRARANWERALRGDARPGADEDLSCYGAFDRPTPASALAAESLVGILTVYRELPLRVLRARVAPRLAGRLLSSEVALGEHAVNLSSWVDMRSHNTPDGGRLLQTTYELGLGRLRTGELPWTVEPTTGAARVAQRALEGAGFVREGEPRLYDVQESPEKIPPETYLFKHAPIE